MQAHDGAERVAGVLDLRNLGMIANADKQVATSVEADAAAEALEVLGFHLGGEDDGDILKRIAGKPGGGELHPTQVAFLLGVGEVEGVVVGEIRTDGNV